MSAFNADKTLEPTYRKIPFDIVDEVLLVDNASQDENLICCGAGTLVCKIQPRAVVLHDFRRGLKFKV